MSDNEAMFHAVAPTGSPEARARFAGLVRRGDRLFAKGGEDWEIRDSERVAARLDCDELRVSLLWKARVLRNTAHRTSFEDPAQDLTPDSIAEVFLADFAARGVNVEEPSDPLDIAWQELLVAAYPQRFTARTTRFLPP